MIRLGNISFGSKPLKMFRCLSLPFMDLDIDETNKIKYIYRLFYCIIRISKYKLNYVDFNDDNENKEIFFY